MIEMNGAQLRGRRVDARRAGRTSLPRFPGVSGGCPAKLAGTAVAVPTARARYWRSTRYVVRDCCERRSTATVGRGSIDGAHSPGRAIFNVNRSSGALPPSRRFREPGLLTRLSAQHSPSGVLGNRKWTIKSIAVYLLARNAAGGDSRPKGGRQREREREGDAAGRAGWPVGDDQVRRLGRKSRDWMHTCTCMHRCTHGIGQLPTSGGGNETGLACSFPCRAELARFPICIISTDKATSPHSRGVRT